MKYLYLLFVLYCLNITAQNKTVSIEYKVTILNEDKLFDKNSALKELLNNAILNAKRLSFNLLVKNGKSKFFNIPILTENQSDNAILPFISYSGNVYSFNDSILIESSILGKNIFIKKNVISNWIITNETKIIDNYFCYKATNTKKVVNGKGIFNHPVIAWFCPNLPYSVGPNGYGNLPGLILELQIRNSVYGVSKINFDSDEDFSSIKTEKIKIISEEEQDELIIKKMEEESGK